MVLGPRQRDGLGPIGGGQASGPDRSVQQLGTFSPEKGPLWRLTHKVHVLLGRFRLKEESLLAALARDGCVFLTEAASGETSGASLTPQRLLGRPPGGRNLPGGSFRGSFSVPRGHRRSSRAVWKALTTVGGICVPAGEGPTT